MEAESALMLCAVAVGAAQIVDCCLLRSGEQHSTTVTAFSMLEWIWGGLCTYLLFKKPDGFPLWIAGIFVAYLVAWVLYIALQAKRGRAVESFELSRSEALAGGLFGAFYATASLATWIGSGT
jgi:hypothetical protein